MENKKKQEIKHIRTLIVEKQNIDFINLIIHKRTLLLAMLIIFFSENLIYFYNGIFFIFISIIFIISPYFILILNRMLLNKKLNKKNDKLFFINLKEQLMAIDKKSNEVFKNSINDNYIIKNSEILFNELKEEKDRRKNGNFSFWNIFTVLPVAAVISAIGSYDEKKIPIFVINITILGIIILFKLIADYSGQRENDTTLEILDEIEDYLSENFNKSEDYLRKNLNVTKTIEKKHIDNKEVFEINEYIEECKTLEKIKNKENNFNELIEILKIKNEELKNNKEYKKLEKGLSKKCKKELDKETIQNVEYKYDEIKEREKYVIIPKNYTIKKNKKNNNEVKENILAIWENNSWEIIETEEELNKYEELKSNIDINSLKNDKKINYIIPGLLGFIFLYSIITPFVFINKIKNDSKEKKYNYTLINTTNKKISITIKPEKDKSFELGLDENSFRDTPLLKEGKHELILDNDQNKKCTLDIKNNLKNGIIDTTSFNKENKPCIMIKYQK